MQLVELLPREHIIAPLNATTVRDALGELIGRLASRGALRGADADRSFDSERIRDIVTVTPDVVLPHYRTSAVDSLYVALGVASEPLDPTDSGIGTEPRIVILVLAPTEAATLYLQAVSTLARLFRDPAISARIAASRSPDDVLRAVDLSAVQLQPRLTVRDIMAEAIHSVTPQTSVREVVDIMIRRRARAVPVVGDKHEVLGIISEWDLMRGLLPQIPRAGHEAGGTGAPDTLSAKDIMTRSVLCVSEELGLEEAASMMMNKDVEQFPVTSEGKLTGFLTRGDIIRKLFGR